MQRCDGPLVEQLAGSWAKTSFDDIPADVVDKVKDNILDTFAVALACVNTEEARRATAAMTALAPQTSSGSSLWGSLYKLPPAQAALVNGTVTHARDFDDGGGPGHAGSTVLPATLAVAEAIGCDGRTLIAATIAGHDIGYRVLQALGGFATHTGRGWHTSGTMGSFAAAAGAAKCLGLDAEQFTHALGIAGSFTGGVWAFIDDSAMTKRLHPGKAGETGVDAALLAQAGFTGPSGFSRRSGAVSTPPTTAARCPRSGAGEPGHRIPGGDVLHQAVCLLPRKPLGNRCASRTVRTRGVTAEDVERIDIYAAETAVNMLSVEPIETVFDAQFSLPYASALALCGGTLTLSEFDPPRMDDPRIRQTYSKISMTTDRSLEIEDGPRLEVTLCSGERVILHSGSPTDAKGSAVNPMAHSEVVAKAEALLAPFGPEAASELVEVVEKLEEAPDLSQLLYALRERVPRG